MHSNLFSLGLEGSDRSDVLVGEGFEFRLVGRVEKSWQKFGFMIGRIFDGISSRARVHVVVDLFDSDFDSDSDSDSDTDSDIKGASACFGLHAFASFASFALFASSPFSSSAAFWSFLQRLVAESRRDSLSSARWACIRSISLRMKAKAMVSIRSSSLVIWPEVAYSAIASITFHLCSSGRVLSGFIQAATKRNDLAFICGLVFGLRFNSVFHPDANFASERYCKIKQQTKASTLIHQNKVPLLFS